MKKRLGKFISIFLIIALLLPTGAFAVGHDVTFSLDNVEYMSSELSMAEEALDGTYRENFELEGAEYTPEPPMIEGANPDDVYNRNYELEYREYMFEAQKVDMADMFNIQYTPGAAYAGYIFRLVENAFVPFSENENIDVIYAQSSR